jgi:hypothetical protein
MPVALGRALVATKSSLAASAGQFNAFEFNYYFTFTYLDHKASSVNKVSVLARNSHQETGQTSCLVREWFSTN